MKLVLHVGVPKAGSSSIQRTLMNNKNALREAGIDYGGDALAMSTRYQGLPSLPSQLVSRFNTVADAENWSEANWQDMAARARAGAADCMVMSSEHFLNIKRYDEFLDRLTDMFSTVHAVAYVRDPVSLLPSSLNQKIRSGARLSQLFSRWELANPMWPAAALERYRTRLGAENLTVRNFDRANLFQGDVVEDFVDILRRQSGCDPTLAEPDNSANESLSGAATAWLLILNESLAGKGGGPPGMDEVRRRNRMRKALIADLRQCDRTHGLPRLKLEEGLIVDFIRHRTRKQCREINSKYLRDQVKLDIGAELSDLPTVVELRNRLRVWIMSYLDGAALEALTGDLLKTEWAK